VAIRIEALQQLLKILAMFWMLVNLVVPYEKRMLLCCRKLVLA
jgi:hypothetical protein